MPGRTLAEDLASTALIALAVPVLLELGQLLYELLSTRFPVAHYFGAFDPIDIVIYIISVGLVVLIERKILAKLLKIGNK